MNEKKETGNNSIFKSKVKITNNHFLINIIFIFIAIFVLTVSSSIFYSTFISKKTNTASGKSFMNDSFSKGEENYYTGEDDWDLKEHDDELNFVQQIETINSDDLKKGARARIGEGGILKFEVKKESHEMLIDLINGNSAEVMMKSNPIFATIKLEDPKKFDLDGDYVYDLEVNLLEIIGNSGIFEIIEISEEYTPKIEAPVQKGDEFVKLSYETVPYVCTEKEKQVEYSSLKISKAGGLVYSEEKIDVVQKDICSFDKSSYRKYYCEGKELKSKYEYCNNRFETCIDAECVVSKYERNIKQQGSPKGVATNISECQIKMGNTIFYSSLSETKCKDIFIGSKFLGKNDFLKILKMNELDSSVITTYFSYPVDLKIYYVDSKGNYNNFDDVTKLFDSKKCEYLNFLGVNTYCFNSIDSSKTNNLRYILNFILFFKKGSVDYKSKFFDGKSFDMILNNDLLYVDASDPNFFEKDFSQYTSLDSIGCSKNSQTYSDFNYLKIGDENRVFVCKDVFVSASIFSDKVSKTSELYFESMKLLSNNINECKTKKIPIIYNKTILIADESDSCFDFYKSFDVCVWETNSEYKSRCDIKSECVYENQTVDESYFEYYVDFGSLYGDYIKYLYKMSSNVDMVCSERQKYWLIAYELATNCENEIDSDDYSSPSYPDNC